MKKLALVVVSVVLLGTFVVSAVYASPPPPVNAHRHYILPDESNPENKVYVGPDFCNNANPGQGFAGFHSNVHKSNPTLKAFENPNNPVKLMAEGCPS